MKRYGWLWAHALLGLFLLGLVLWAFGRGLDFTDEADSLLATAQPSFMTLRFSEYMFYTNWLYCIAGESLFWFRFSGLVLLIIPSLYFGHELTKWLQGQKVLNNQSKICILLCIVVSSSAYYCKWYPSPNYYWMAQVGLTIVAGSLIHISRLHREGRFSLLLFALLGLGMTITGFGRVSTAALAVIMVCVVVLFIFWGEKKLWIWGLLVFGLTGLVLLLLHMIVVADGVWSVIDVYLRMFSTERASERGSMDSQLRTLFEGFLYLGDKVLKGGWMLFGVPSLAFLFWKSRIIRKYPIWMMGIVLVYYCRYFWRSYGDPSEIGATMFTMCLLSSIVFVAFMPLECRIKYTLTGWGTVLFFLTVTFGFGSAMPLTWGASRSLIFLSAGIVMCVWFAGADEQKNGSVQCLSFMTMLLAFGLVFMAIGVQTYRQPSLLHHTEQVVVRGEGVSIKLWPDAADFIKTLQIKAAENGWIPGTPLLDFGADNAGVAYVLGAATPGNGRIYGGYDNTDAFARLVTGCLTPEQKKNAWIVTSTDIENRVTPSVVQEMFPHFPEKYVKVWEHTNVGADGKSNTVLTLWKPT